MAASGGRDARSRERRSLSMASRPRGRVPAPASGGMSSRASSWIGRYASARVASLGRHRLVTVLSSESSHMRVCRHICRSSVIDIMHTTDAHPSGAQTPSNDAKPADPRHALGRRGEELAAEHLHRLGFSPLGRNERTRYGEIDLIAFDGRTLVFAEVKTRRVDARPHGPDPTSSPSSGSARASASVCAGSPPPG